MAATLANAMGTPQHQNASLGLALKLIAKVASPAVPAENLDAKILMIRSGTGIVAILPTVCARENSGSSDHGFKAVHPNHLGFPT